MSRTADPFAPQLAATIVFVIGAAVLVAPAWGNEDLSDPMRPPMAVSQDASAAAAPKYVLHGTILGSERRIALVNGTVVTLGDRIGDAELIGIEVGRIILAEGGTELELTTTTYEQRSEEPVVAERIAHEDS